MHDEQRLIFVQIFGDIDGKRRIATFVLGKLSAVQINLRIGHDPLEVNHSHLIFSEFDFREFFYIAAIKLK